MTDEERDDDDTPYTRDDNATHPMQHAADAAHRYGTDFYRAFKNANSGDPALETRGLIEMQLITIREGEWPGREGYQKLAPHIPEDEAGMRRLATSKVPADAEVKADLYAWARSNRAHREQAAKAIEVAAGAYRRADAILSDEECTDGELGEWVTEIVEHIMQEWKINIRLAPLASDELRAWALEAAGRFDLTPRWLTGEERLNVFDPAAHAKKRGPKASVKDPARPFKAYVRDDD